MGRCTRRRIKKTRIKRGTKRSRYEKKGGNSVTNTNNNEAANVALQNTGRVLAQSAANVADKIATPIVQAMGVDLNEPVDKTVDRIVGPLETGVAVLKQPRVKKVIQEGLAELVEDAKPAFNKLASDSVSLVANVAEDVAGPLIGIPRTLGNVANIAETGIDLAKKTMGNVSDMTNEISAATSEATNMASEATNMASEATNMASNVSNVANEATNKVASNLNQLKQSQQRAFDNSKRSMEQLTNPLAATGTLQNKNKTMHGGRKRPHANKKTRKQSIFQQLHAYF
jgi:methyl-accepting chemotaxis protein